LASFFISSIFPDVGLTIFVFFDLEADALSFSAGFFFIGLALQSSCGDGHGPACGNLAGREHVTRIPSVRQPTDKQALSGALAGKVSKSVSDRRNQKTVCLPL
jgi:hypothetical protein